MAKVIITVPPGTQVMVLREGVKKQTERREEKPHKKILRYTWIFIKSFFRASFFVLRIFFWFFIALCILLAVSSGGDRC